MAADPTAAAALAAEKLELEVGILRLQFRALQARSVRRGAPAPALAAAAAAPPRPKSRAAWSPFMTARSNTEFDVAWNPFCATITDLLFFAIAIAGGRLGAHIGGHVPAGCVSQGTCVACDLHAIRERCRGAPSALADTAAASPLPPTLAACVAFGDFARAQEEAASQFAVADVVGAGSPLQLSLLASACAARAEAYEARVKSAHLFVGGANAGFADYMEYVGEDAAIAAAETAKAEAVVAAAAAAAAPAAPPLRLSPLARAAIPNEFWARQCGAWAAIGAQGAAVGCLGVQMPPHPAAAAAAPFEGWPGHDPAVWLAHDAAWKRAQSSALVDAVAAKCAHANTSGASALIYFVLSVKPVAARVGGLLTAEFPAHGGGDPWRAFAVICRSACQPGEFILYTTFDDDGRAVVYSTASGQPMPAFCPIAGLAQFIDGAGGGAKQVAAVLLRRQTPRRT